MQGFPNAERGFPSGHTGGKVPHNGSLPFLQGPLRGGGFPSEQTGLLPSLHFGGFLGTNSGLDLSAQAGLPPSLQGPLPICASVLAKRRDVMMINGNDIPINQGFLTLTKSKNGSDWKQHVLLWGILKDWNHVASLIGWIL